MILRTCCNFIIQSLGFVVFQVSKPADAQCVVIAVLLDWQEVINGHVPLPAASSRALVFLEAAIHSVQHRLP